MSGPGVPEGMLTLDELQHAAGRDEIDTVVVGFTDHYGRLVGKRYDAGMFLDEVAAHGTHGCDYLLTTDMEMEPVPGYELANWELGYGDVHLVPDMATLRRAAWLDRTALVLCDVADGRDETPVAAAPRTILRRQVDAAATQGLTSMAATELEYYLYRSSYRDAAAGGYADLQPAGWYLEDYHLMQGARTEDFTAEVRRHLRHSGVPVESSKGEWGRGQHEVNFVYTEPVAMADMHVVFKQGIKELAAQQNRSITFMAKPSMTEAGNSCHIHCSLWKDGRNAFAAEDARGQSQLFRQFLGGLLKYSPELCYFFGPTINSYKRYQPGSWAPTKMAWSNDNRTVGFRIVGHGTSLRIENRMPGADANPYLAFTAMLMAGLDGIQNRIDPGEPLDKDIYDLPPEELANVPSLPGSLDEAQPKVALQRMVQTGVELVVGVAHDSLFGSLVMVGLGGVHTDLLGDRSFRSLPLNELPVESDTVGK